MTNKRKDCPMRDETCNCTVAGGFCTAVNDPICEALHNAFDCGYRSALRRQETVTKCNDLFDEDGGEISKSETVTNRSRLNEPLTLDEMRKMDDPVWCSCKPIEGGNGYWCLCKNGIIITPAGSTYDVAEIPHWVFYRQKPEEGTE